MRAERKNGVKREGRKRTGMKPSNWVEATILPSLKTSLPMTALQVLQDDRADFAYSAFHGFGGLPAILLTHTLSLLSLSRESATKE